MSVKGALLGQHPVRVLTPVCSDSWISYPPRGLGAVPLVRPPMDAVQAKVRETYDALQSGTPSDPLAPPQDPHYPQTNCCRGRRYQCLPHPPRVSSPHLLPLALVGVRHLAHCAHPHHQQQLQGHLVPRPLNSPAHPLRHPSLEQWSSYPQPSMEPPHPPAPVSLPHTPCIEL